MEDDRPIAGVTACRWCDGSGRQPGDRACWPCSGTGEVGEADAQMQGWTINMARSSLLMLAATAAWVLAWIAPLPIRR